MVVFFAAERVVLFIISTLAVVDLALIVRSDISVDWLNYLISIAIGLSLLGVGQVYRTRRPDRRLAAALIASGLFILFSIVGSVFNYMFLPITGQPIDPLLIRIDAALGYEWRRTVMLAAHYPLIGTLLFAVYATSLPQMLLIILMLGFGGEQSRLHHFMLVGTLGALASIAFWIVFPTYGAKAYYDLPEWVVSAIPLAVDPAYGAELMRLGREGVQFLTPKDVLGLIGFPSFHIVMAAMSVYFAPRNHAIRTTLYALNVLMLPAVLVQGGHHLTDVVGGLALFAVVCPLSSVLLGWLGRGERPDAQACRHAVDC